jgi:hypothetical protein
MQRVDPLIGLRLDIDSRRIRTSCSVILAAGLAANSPQALAAYSYE